MRINYLKLKYLLLCIFLFAFCGEVLPAICLGEAPLQNITGSILNAPALTITSLAPTQAFDSGIIQFTIHGEGFPDSIGLKLIQNGFEIQGLYPEVSAGNQIQCFFDLSGKPFGVYDLVLTAPDGGLAIFKAAFQIRIFVLVYDIDSQIKPIFFDYDQFKIREDQLYALQENMKLLLANPFYYILLEGYTDPQGSMEYNLGLSLKRVESIRRILVEAGIPDTRIFACYHPNEFPSLAGIREKNWDKARQVDISLSETPPYKGD